MSYRQISGGNQVIYIVGTPFSSLLSDSALAITQEVPPLRDPNGPTQSANHRR